MRGQYPGQVICLDQSELRSLYKLWWCQDVTEGWLPRGGDRLRPVFGLCQFPVKLWDKESRQNLIFTLRPGQVFQTEKQRNIQSERSQLSSPCWCKSPAPAPLVPLSLLQSLREHVSGFLLVDVNLLLQTPCLPINTETPGETNLCCLHCHHNNISGLQECQECQEDPGVRPVRSVCSGGKFVNPRESGPGEQWGIVVIVMNSTASPCQKQQNRHREMLRFCSVNIWEARPVPLFRG